MPGARQVDLGGLGLHRPRVHPLLPVGVVAVDDLQGDRAAERAAVAHAGGDLDPVALDLHPPAAAVAELAAGQIAVRARRARAPSPRAAPRRCRSARARATRRRWSGAAPSGSLGRARAALGSAARRGAASAGCSWASMPGIRSPVPRHHGQVTSCGVPPSPEIRRPVPRQAMQVPSRCRSRSRVGAHNRAHLRGWGVPAAARIAASDAGTPVNCSKLSAPWPTRSSRPSTAGTPRAWAAADQRGPAGGVDQVDEAAEVGQIRRRRAAAPRAMSDAVEPHRGAVDQQVGRARRSTPASRPARRTAARARSGVRFQIRTSAAPASSSAHTAARALPPAPSTSALWPAIGPRQRRDQRRGVGVVGDDRRALGPEDERVGGADRAGPRGWARWPAPAPPACGGWSR